MFNLEERSSLLSLLELLNLSEYFVTVDHSVQWQRHISWSKPNGEDLRQYVTQRYSSNMVFLSCMLAAQINVFFNSSKELTDMRSLLGVQSHGILRYWIGVSILLDISTTIIALVTTFTLWGMVSSISDANTHALLRSSIGQYVTSLPSKFTVAALYLFLLWIILFVADLVKGPVQACLLFMIFFMFFQVVIPLSAFGRLIIHTGAMATRPVLDKELERELLPSGLHASLLIRATDRRRKYSNATDQYRKQNKKSKRGADSAIATASLPSSHHNTSSLPSSHHPPQNISFDVPRLDSDELTLDGSVASKSIDVEGGSSRPLHGHRRMETFDTVGSDNFFFPGANILNATLSQRDIQDVVERSVRLSTMGGNQGGPGAIHLSLDNFPTPEEIEDTNDNTPLETNKPNSVEEPSNKDNKGRHRRVLSNGGVGGHRRQGSGAIQTTPRENQSPKATSTPRIQIEVENPNNKNTIMSGRAEASPTVLGRKAYSTSSPLGRRETFNPHPLLTSPVNGPARPPTHRPPKRGSKNRPSHGRKSGSILGFLPLKSALEEMEEENEVRELFDAPPAVSTEERLSREFDPGATAATPQMGSRSAIQHRRTNSQSGRMPTSGGYRTQQNDTAEGNPRQRASSEPLVETPEESTHLLADFRSSDRYG